MNDTSPVLTVIVSQRSLVETFSFCKDNSGLLGCFVAGTESLMVASSGQRGFIQDTPESGLESYSEPRQV